MGLFLLSQINPIGEIHWNQSGLKWEHFRDEKFSPGWSWRKKISLIPTQNLKILISKHFKLTRLNLGTYKGCVRWIGPNLNVWDLLRKTTLLLAWIFTWATLHVISVTNIAINYIPIVIAFILPLLRCIRPCLRWCLAHQIYHLTL